MTKVQVLPARGWMAEANKNNICALNYQNMLAFFRKASTKWLPQIRARSAHLGNVANHASMWPRLVSANFSVTHGGIFVSILLTRSKILLYNNLEM